MSLLSLGKLPDGREIREALLFSEAGAQARIMEFGATLRDLLVPVAGGVERVVLGFDGLDVYAQGGAHHAGAIAGRYANRVAQGSFTLDGSSFQLERNEGGRNALHGGKSGFGKRPWTIVEHGTNAVTLALVSAAGEGGYPGTLRLWCRYELIEPSTLTLELEATCDAATIINLAQHSYFNLDGGEDVRDHELMIAADFYTPTDRALIPTGEIAPVGRHALRFSLAAADPPRAARRLGAIRLRHEFRAARLAWRESGRGRARPCGDVVEPPQRPLARSLHQRARLAGLRLPSHELRGAGPWRAPLRERRRPRPRGAAFPRQPEPGAFPLDRAAPRRDLSPAHRISLHERLRCVAQRIEIPVTWGATPRMPSI